MRIAVIGGGIAGCGAAWALARGGGEGSGGGEGGGGARRRHSVTIFEAAKA
eukprot:COSAG01_NODE_54674_length_330_cov_1.121212_1_plen_50_part_10